MIQMQAIADGDGRLQVESFAASHRPTANQTWSRLCTWQLDEFLLAA